MSLGMPGFDVAVECYVGVVFIHYSRDPLHHTRSIPTADVGWACVNPGVMSSVSDWRLPRGIPSVGSERRGGGGGRRDAVGSLLQALLPVFICGRPMLSNRVHN